MNIIKYVSSQFAKPMGIGGKITTFFMNKMNQLQYNGILNVICSYQKDTEVLDIGFGNGYMLKKLAPKEYLLYGIDISEDMVEMAMKKLSRHKNIVLKHGSVENLDFDSNIFNIVYTVNTIYFWQDLKTGLSEIYRVLQNGGIFVNAFYSRKWLDKTVLTKYNYIKYAVDEIRKEAIKIGFKEINIIEIEKDKSFVMVMEKQAN